MIAIFKIEYSKRLVKVEQAKALHLRSDEPGFTWYRKSCCELTCEICGIQARLHRKPDNAVGSSSSSASSIEALRDCEFNCKDKSGSDIPVVIKVKMYCEQLRSGSFQKEMEEVTMSSPDFKDHFTKCAEKYLIHHFYDVLSLQARRNMYEKVVTEQELSTIIMASDYSAIMDGHSQDQLNQTIQLHSLQLVILLSYLCSGVLMTTAYSFWSQESISKLKTDNHFYRQCKDRVISDAKA